MADFEDSNPFADSAVRQATASPNANRQTDGGNTPFANTTTPAQPAPSSQPTSSAAFLPSPQPPAYQPSAYTPVPTPEPVKQPPTTTRIDLTEHDRRQAELEARERELAERERKLTNKELVGKRDNNFPPLPKFFPCGSCFYQDIGVEIPNEFQLWVRYLFYIWLFYSFTLFLNMIAALSYFLTEAAGAVTFGVSILYLILFIPSAYVCWFRPIYRAFREDSAVNFMIFFFVFFMQIVITVLQFLGIGNLGCGFFLMIRVFASGGRKILVGFIMLIVTICFAILVIVDSLILMQVHRLYRKTGASIEQAQKEFQTAFVNSPTVRGAAREAASAGINEALRSDGDRVY